jgi:hypothetical protein
VRTTITLDPDVESMIRMVMREQGLSFKKALNEAVRAGLSPRHRRPRRRFTQKTYSLGSEQHFRWDKALAVAEAMETEELARKLSLRK